MTIPQEGDLRWALATHQGGKQWVRVVVDCAYLPDKLAVVRALFPGDSFVGSWHVPFHELRTEEPSFDEINATYEGGGDCELV